LLTRCTCRSCL